MFVSDKVISLFQIAKDTVDSLREELASLRASHDAAKVELATSKVMNDWLRVKINQLEFERVALLEKAYGIRVPAPELTRHRPATDPDMDPRNFSFEDIGDEVAHKLGLPLYGDKN